MKRSMLLACIGLMAFALTAGCKVIRVDDMRQVPAGQTIPFAAQSSGAMMKMTIDPAQLTFATPEAEAAAKLEWPDLSKIPAISGWFLYNLDPVE